MFTQDDEVQISRKMYGLDVYFGIVKKDNLSILDKIKKWLNIADEWIDYKYHSGIYHNNEFSDDSIHANEYFLRNIEKKYDIKNILWNTAKSLSKNHIKDEFTIYGIIYGNLIHSHYDYNLNSIEFVGSDIFESKNFLAPDVVKLIFDNLLHLPHVDILHTGEWSQELQEEYTNSFIENIGIEIPHAGIVIKHVSGDREKIQTIYNPKFRTYIQR
jgi:hypothetical protein